MSQGHVVSLSITEELVESYVEQVLKKTVVGDVFEEETQPEQKLKGLLNSYAKDIRQRNGVNESVLRGLSNPDGVTSEALEEALKREPGASNWYRGYGDTETLEDSANYALPMGQTIEKVLLAIPPSVATQVWGSNVDDWIFVSLARGESEVNEKGEKIEGKLRIYVSGHNYRTGDLMRSLIGDEAAGIGGMIPELMKEATGGYSLEEMSEILRAQWRLKVAQKIKEARGNISQIKRTILNVNKAANVNNVDKWNVTGVGKVDISVTESQQENAPCDFVVTVKTTYSVEPKQVGAKKKQQTVQQEAPRRVIELV